MIPLRVDVAGGWLDVPKHAIEGAFIVNCAIEPFYTVPGAGLGGSATIGNVESELKIAGWQDAAVIQETGLCVWRSGPLPVLEAKYNPDFLRGLMAVLWTGKPHDTKSLVDHPRSYARIEQAAKWAIPPTLANICRAMNETHNIQFDEGMPFLPSFGEAARKYAGSGHGGYGIYLFNELGDREKWIAVASAAGHEVRAIEPYMRGYA